MGPAVLVIHGRPGGYDQGLWISDRMTRLTPFAALLDVLRVPQAAVIGFSAGGPPALQFALRQPGRTPARCKRRFLFTACSTVPSIPSRTFASRLW